MERMEELKHKLDNTMGQDRIQLLLDYGFSFHMQNPDKMFELTEEAMVLARKYSDTEGISRCLQQQSVYWGIRGNYDRALETALEAMATTSESTGSKRMAGLYNNLAIIYCRLEDTENSTSCAEKAISMADEAGVPSEKARGYNNLAMNMEEAGKHREAYQYYNRAAGILEELGKPEQGSIALLNTAAMAVETGSLDEAESKTRRAMHYAEKINSKYIEAGAINTLGRVHSMRGSALMAEECFLKALDMAEELKNADLQLRFLGDLVVHFEKTENFRRALEYNKKQAALRQRIVVEKQNMNLARMKARFETREKERENELYRLRNLELLTEKKAAEASDRAKSSFLAMMSHELRTPMNIINGMLEILLEENPRPEQSEMLIKARNASGSLLGIINDILDFSTIEAGKFKIQNRAMSIADVIEDTRRFFADTASEAGLEFECTVDQSFPAVVTGDPLRLTQIIRNLVSNALKFTESGGIKVTAVARCRTDDSVTGEFCVSDTGRGISADKLELLFKPFQQLDDSMTRKHGGTGLGLAICKRMLEQMGGDIGVKSTPEKGSSFCFSIPFPVPENELMDSEALVQELPDLSGKRILITEDQLTIGEIAGHFIAGAGGEYTIATNGREAVEIASSEEFDVILMDIQMPEMDGVTAAELIRSNGITVPVIATTGHAMPSHFTSYTDAGIDDCLAKPYGKKELLTVIGKWIK